MSKLSKMWDQMLEHYPPQFRHLLPNLVGVTELEFKEDPTPAQLAGLQHSATGYGDKVPTSRKVWAWGRWRRVYCKIHSNAGSCYIIAGGKIFLVDPR